jgi:hypothetical protein
MKEEEGMKHEETGMHARGKDARGKEDERGMHGRDTDVSATAAALPLCLPSTLLGCALEALLHVAWRESSRLVLDYDN